MPRMAETSAPIFIAPSAALVDALGASLVSYSYGRFHLLWPFGRGNVV